MLSLISALRRWIAGGRRVLTGRIGIERRVTKHFKRQIRVEAERIRILEERLRILESTAFVSHSDTIERFAQMLRPVPNSHDFERIGSSRDGGYLIPRDLPRPDGVISIGVGPECSADEAMAERGVPVWQFDHTVLQSPSDHPNIKFRRLGVRSSLEPSRKDLQSLRNLLSLVVPSESDRLWLFFDAEGVEWDVLVDQEADLDRFDVISIELHRISWLTHPEFREIMLNGLERLRSSHAPVAWHPNNFAPTIILGNHYVCDVLEVTFVKTSLIVLAGSDGASLEDLAQPNNPHGYQAPEPFSVCSENPYGDMPFSLRTSIAQGFSRKQSAHPPRLADSVDSAG